MTELATDLIPITADTPVEVGQTYNVRCLRMLVRTVFSFVHGSSSPWRFYIPVIGHAHRDEQFGVPAMHYHIDGRFCEASTGFAIRVNEDGRTNDVINIEDPTSKLLWEVQGIEVRPCKCVRLTTGLIMDGKGSFSPKYENWYNSHVGKSCAGKRCPHLGTHMLEENGKLVCPLHHLVGDPATMCIVPLEEMKQSLKTQ